MSRALDWASALWDMDPQIHHASFTYFAGMIRKVFEYPAGGKDTSLQLMELRQGSDSAVDYAIKFRTLAAQSGWNDTALWAVFCKGLSPALQTELTCREDATSLSQYVATAICLDNLLHQHRAGARPPISARPHLDYPRPREEAPKPMQLGRSWLTEREQRRCTQMRLCYYCGGSGHLIHRCLEKLSSVQVALIDSGAAVNLIVRALVEVLRIPTIPCMPSLRIMATDSQPIGGLTELLNFKVGLFHREHLAFYITSLPANPGILGFPWLRQHDPQISWHKGELVHCPKGRVYSLSLPEVRAMEKYIEEALAVSHIRSSTSPAAAGFFFVGKKDGSLRLCIDYRGLNAITVRYPYPLPLEGDEWKTAFQTTHGHYEYLVMPFGLTNAPVVFQSLINEVFQDILGKLQQNHLYIKPEKCEFHRTTITFLGYVISRQGVEMYLTKVRAVTEWPNPTMTKELQRFLELGNFYRRFIRNYSSVAGPLTSLLRGKPRRLSWSDQAQVAFSKDSFTMAPILRHPDPDLPFVVEVDASSCGIGAMLSQRHGVPGKLHPCAFFFRKLTVAEANYNVGNRELLSIKAALEEWRHAIHSWSSQTIVTLNTSTVPST
ncbi:hypothetical protein QTP70_034396 [Hemibagrus guttatus]|uniref:CCHC-type domain-containing protein n=1 Tax=Hemibagrus guttatus TaxID=175788 RepID=A0AAE0QU07_9TELE|nr:hypothetical protein QTP70_034396 [Hemibagrus guttatus]